MYSSRLRGRSELSTTTSASCRSAASMLPLSSSSIPVSIAAPPPFSTVVRTFAVLYQLLTPVVVVASGDGTQPAHRDRADPARPDHLRGQGVRRPPRARLVHGRPGLAPGRTPPPAHLRRARHAR